MTSDGACNLGTFVLHLTDREPPSCGSWSFERSRPTRSLASPPCETETNVDALDALNPRAGRASTGTGAGPIGLPPNESAPAPLQRPGAWQQEVDPDA
jgi:hypothetical protein